MGVPVNSLASPRFCGVRTFQRLPHSADCSGNDFAVLGVPFDTATSYRPGCRFGPAAIRDASSILKSYHSVLDVDIFEHCQGVDAGDVDIIPGYLDESFERIEAAVTREKCRNGRSRTHCRNRQIFAFPYHFPSIQCQRFWRLRERFYTRLRDK